MAGLDQRAVLDVVVTAVAGQRALFNPGWSAGRPLELPPNFYVLGDTPHDWLFARTSVVVHHGGSGTTHSAARAGVPSVVLPFAADQCHQFFWAEQLRRQGVAPEPVAVHRLTAAKLARAIAAVRSTGMRERASVVGTKMRMEDGLATAVDRVHRLLGGYT